MFQFDYKTFRKQYVNALTFTQHAPHPVPQQTLVSDRLAALQADTRAILQVRSIQSTEPLTSAALAVARAEAVKAARWKSYVPLSYDQLWDDLKPETTVILSPVHVQNANGGRSTYRSATYCFQNVVFKRPTEVEAILRARRILVLPEDLRVIRQAPERDDWWCGRCARFKPIDHFAHDKRFPNQTAFWCKTCREEHTQGVRRLVFT